MWKYFHYYSLDKTDQYISFLIAIVFVNAGTVTIMILFYLVRCLSKEGCLYWFSTTCLAVCAWVVLATKEISNDPAEKC